MEVKEFGISNTELEHFFKNNGRKLLENFAGVFLADKKRNLWTKQVGKKQSILSWYQILTWQESCGSTGGRFSISMKRTRYIFLTALTFMVY